MSEQGNLTLYVLELEAEVARLRAELQEAAEMLTECYDDDEFGCCSFCEAEIDDELVVRGTSDTGAVWRDITAHKPDCRYGAFLVKHT